MIWGDFWVEKRQDFLFSNFYVKTGKYGKYIFNISLFTHN